MDFLKPVGESAGALMASRPMERKGELVVRNAGHLFAEMSQVTVDPDEVAVMLRAGAVAGVLVPGRHTLMPSALPFLEQLRAQGGYQADLYFVSTTPVRACKFGGLTDHVVDSQNASGQFMLFGDYTARVVDVARFAPHLASGEDALGWFNASVKSRAEACLMQWISAGYFTLQTATQAGPQLARTVAPHFADFADQGLQLVSLDSVEIKLR